MRGCWRSCVAVRCDDVARRGMFCFLSVFLERLKPFRFAIVFYDCCVCVCVCRVCELDGKVRELESSMARMGAQHDVNMELIDTFRHQKETASLRAYLFLVPLHVRRSWTSPSVLSERGLHSCPLPFARSTGKKARCRKSVQWQPFVSRHPGRRVAVLPRRPARGTSGLSF